MSLSDNEIIKDFEEKVNFIGSMEDVYLNENQGYALYCAMNNILDFINRQKAEVSVLRKLLDKAETEMNNQSENIKKLTEDYYSIQSTLAKMSTGVQQAKAEAIKAFAERLKQRFYACPEVNDYVANVYIDNLVKEMVGDAE